MLEASEAKILQKLSDDLWISKIKNVIYKKCNQVYSGKKQLHLLFIRFLKPMMSQINTQTWSQLHSLQNIYSEHFSGHKLTIIIY